MSFTYANSGDMSDGTDVISDVCGSAGDNISPCQETGAGRNMNMSQTISAITTPQREKGREKDRQTTPERAMRSFLNFSSPERSMPVSACAVLLTRSCTPIPSHNLMSSVYHSNIKLTIQILLFIYPAGSHNRLGVTDPGPRFLASELSRT
jgi:hypothetical protein